jgi:oligopeptide/dipeptide ABC transporter ATP-binding protein
VPLSKTWAVSSEDIRAGQILLEVSDLAVTYASDRDRPVYALESATFEIASGQAIGILGESGSGKSTLALALLRLLSPVASYRSGSVRFCGRDLFRISEAELRTVRGAEIALIPQDPALTLNPVMRVGVQISEVSRAHTQMTRAERLRRTQEVLREVGLDDPIQIASAYPHQLSGGQRQRVVIAQALVCRPSLIIADEPTSKLDAQLQVEIIALMTEIQRRNKVAFMLITHDPTLIAGFDRMLVMYGGRIVEQGSVADLFRRPLHPYTQDLVALARGCMVKSAANAKSLLPVIAGDPPDLTCKNAGCRFEPRCRDRMQLCTSAVPPELISQPSHRVSCYKYGG